MPDRVGHDDRKVRYATERSGMRRKGQVCDGKVGDARSGRAWQEGQGSPNYGSGNSSWPHHCEGGENFQLSIADFRNVRTFVPSLIKVCYNLLQIRHHPNDVFSFFSESYRGAYSEPPRIVFTSSKQFNQWKRKRIMRIFGLLSRWFTRYLSKSERTHASAMARKRTSVHTIVCIGVLYDS